MNQTVPGDLGHSPGEDPPDPFQTAGKSTLIDPQSAIPLFVFPWFSCQSVSINSQFAIRLSFVSLCLSCQSVSINPQFTIRNSQSAIRNSESAICLSFVSLGLPC